MLTTNLAGMKYLLNFTVLSALNLEKHNSIKYPILSKKNDFIHAFENKGSIYSHKTDKTKEPMDKCRTLNFYDTDEVQKNY